MGSLTIQTDIERIEHVLVNGVGGADTPTFTYDGNSLAVDSLSTAALISLFLTSDKTQAKTILGYGHSRALALGFTCTNGIKMDANMIDIIQLKHWYDLAVALSETTMDIRDYSKMVHAAVGIASVGTMISELSINYRSLLSNKWAKEAEIDAATTVAEVEAVVW